MSACPSTGRRGLGPGNWNEQQGLSEPGGEAAREWRRRRQRHSWPSGLCCVPAPPAPLSRLCPYLCRPSQGLPPLLFPAFPRPLRWVLSWPHPNPTPLASAAGEGGFFALWTEWKQTDRLRVETPQAKVPQATVSGFLLERDGGASSLAGSWARGVEVRDDADRASGWPSGPFPTRRQRQASPMGSHSSRGSGKAGSRGHWKPEAAQGQKRWSCLSDGALHF